MKYTIGCDPEIFFSEPSGKLRSVIGLLGGNKMTPMMWEPGFSHLEDNVAAEFNIPPCKSAEEFSEAVTKSVIHLESEAKKHGLILSKVVAMDFDDDQLLDPRAFQFGCEPDFNAWTNKVNPAPSGFSTNLRSVGGHVHIGFNHQKYNRNQVIQACDLFLGVPSVMIDHDTKRRELYGKAGAHRKKVYGAEYRTLSNFWIWEKGMHNWVYKQVEKALNFVEDKNNLSEDAEIIQKAINTSNLNLVEQLMEKYEI